MTRITTVAGVLLLCLGSTVAAEAASWERFNRRNVQKAKCPGHKTVVRVDSRACPATKRRPALTVQRACCASAKGRVHCKPYAPCPRRSPE